MKHSSEIAPPHLPSTRQAPPERCQATRHSCKNVCGMQQALAFPYGWQALGPSSPTTRHSPTEGWIHVCGCQVRWPPLGARGCRCRELISVSGLLYQSEIGCWQLGTAGLMPPSRLVSAIPRQPLDSGPPIEIIKKS